MGDNNGFSENTCPDDLVGGCSESPPPTVYLRRIEIVFENADHSGSDWQRKMFPHTRDIVALQAIVWATEDSGDRQGQPYTFWQGAQDGGSLANDGERFFSMCRGPVGNTRPTAGTATRQARPDLYNRRAFRMPNLDVWENHRLPSSFPVSAWPSRWPHPSFTWHEVSYRTQTCRARDPRPYYYENTSAVEPSPNSQGWYTAFPPYGLSAGVHRFNATASLQGTQVSCPTGNNERNMGFILQVSVRETEIPERDSAVHEQSIAQHPELASPLIDINENITEWLRWMSAFLKTPYEVGGKWFGGLSRGGRGTNVTADTGYGGFGLDCTGLPSTARALSDQAWGSSHPAWRRSTYRQHNPVPGIPLYDHWNDWQWSSSGWTRRTGRFDRFTRDIVRYAQPGDFLDTGNPDGPINHIRIIYQIVERNYSGSGDTWIEIIEASSSEAGEVRLTRNTRSGGLLLLLQALENSETQYGLWRPLPSHPSISPW